MAQRRALLGLAELEVQHGSIQRGGRPQELWIGQLGAAADRLVA